MPALGAGIHAFAGKRRLLIVERKAWMPGPSPGMTFWNAIIIHGVTVISSTSNPSAGLKFSGTS